MQFTTRPAAEAAAEQLYKVRVHRVTAQPLLRGMVQAHSINHGTERRKLNSEIWGGFPHSNEQKFYIEVSDVKGVVLQSVNSGVTNYLTTFCFFSSFPRSKAHGLNFALLFQHSLPHGIAALARNSAW